MSNLPYLDDQTFVKQFEDFSLDTAHFNHNGHLRIAWSYLNQGCTLENIDKICIGILRYADHLGAHDKYHHTLSYTLALIIAQRLIDHPVNSWEAFVDKNPDITNSALEVVQGYFSFDLFEHPTAKNQLIKADLAPLNYLQ